MKILDVESVDGIHEQTLSQSEGGRAQSTDKSVRNSGRNRTG